MDDNDYLHACFPSRLQTVTDRIERELDMGSSSDSSSVASGVLVPMHDAQDKGEKINGQWEYEPFEIDDWGSIVEEPTDDPHFCYLCTYKQTDKEQEGNPQLKRFFDFLMDNYALMTRVTLGVQARSVYNSILRPHTKHKKPMRCKTFVDHIEKHAVFQRIQLEHQNRTVNHCLMLLSDQLQQRDRGSKEKKLRPDKQNMSMYVKWAQFGNGIGDKLSKMRPAEGTRK